MNKELLNTEVQTFINTNLNTNILNLILKGTPFVTLNTTEIVQQLEAKKRAQKKLPTWFSAKNIYYPSKLNIEQTSSEITAKYKANLVSGQNLIDLTGGFGIDCFYFSKKINKVIHCEINKTLSDIVLHNYKQLNVNNINCLSKSGIAVLKETKLSFSWVYIDPSRRNDNKGKVFLLKECLPDVTKHLNLLFEKTKNVMIKTSPLLDITATINELEYVKCIHIIAVNNDVKELLWVLEHKYNSAIEIKTVNIKNEVENHFNFNFNEEKTTYASLSKPLTYLYEPNSAILKSGAFNSLANKLNIKKLHQHSHLYTCNKLIAFPGRCFKIEKTIAYNKKIFKQQIKISKANVTVRNFPETVKQIRKKLTIADGGNCYLFFTTNFENKKIIISTTKIT